MTEIYVTIISLPSSFAFGVATPTAFTFFFSSEWATNLDWRRPFPKAVKTISRAFLFRAVISWDIAWWSLVRIFLSTITASVQEFWSSTVRKKSFQHSLQTSSVTILSIHYTLFSVDAVKYFSDDTIAFPGYSAIIRRTETMTPPCSTIGAWLVHRFSLHSENGQNALVSWMQQWRIAFNSLKATPRYLKLGLASTTPVFLRLDSGRDSLASWNKCFRLSFFALRPQISSSWDFISRTRRVSRLSQSWTPFWLSKVFSWGH